MKRAGLIIKIFGLFLLSYMLYHVGWKQTFVAVQSVSITYVILAVLVLWSGYFIKSVRWKLLADSYKISLSYAEAFKFYMIGLFLGNITPGKLGDFGRLYYLKSKMADKKIGLSSLLMDRVFDLLGLLFFSLIGLIYLDAQHNMLSGFGSKWLVMGGAIILLCGFLVIFLVKRYLKTWLEAFKSNHLTASGVLVAFCLTCVSMALLYSIFNLVAYDLEIQIDQLGLFLGTFVVGILALLPISIMGIGVREGTLVVLFKLYGLPPEKALAMGLIVFFIQLISFLPGVVWFYTHR